MSEEEKRQEEEIIKWRKEQDERLLDFFKNLERKKQNPLEFPKTKEPKNK